MGCRRYERMLYLHRSGELSLEETRELERHLESCEECASLKERIATTDAYVKKMRRMDPRLEQPDVFAGKVLERIRGAGRASGMTASPDLLDRLLDYFLRPPVRYASAAILVIAVGSFMLQYFSLLQDVVALERSMASRASTTVGPVVSYSIRRAELPPLADKNIEWALGQFPDMAQSNGAVVVEINTLKSLVGLLDLNASLFFRGQWDRDRADALVREASKHARTLIKFPHGG